LVGSFAEMSLLEREEIIELVSSGALKVSRVENGILVGISQNREVIEGKLEIKGTKLDLHVGEEFLLFSEVKEKLGDNIMKLKEGEGFNLKPGDTVIIKTREYIEMPKNVGGLISSKLPLVSFGISHVSTTLDPTFQGYLAITMTNVGGYNIQFDFGDPIAYATLFWITGKKETSFVYPRTQPGPLSEILLEKLLHPMYFKTKKSKISDDDDLEKIKESFMTDSKWRGTPFDNIYKLLDAQETRVNNIEKKVNGIRRDAAIWIAVIGILIAIISIGISIFFKLYA
jgi:deoxycytidine triphosphate deaminase